MALQTDLVEKLKETQPQELSIYQTNLIFDACYTQDIQLLTSYHDQGVDFDLLRTPWGHSLLQYAITFDKPQTFDALLSFGCELESHGGYDGTTPFHYAALSDQFEYADKLVAAGAEINCIDFFGFTPLLEALFFEQEKAADYLLAMPELDVNIPLDITTPVAMAYLLDDWQTVDKIIAHTSFDPLYNQLMLMDSELYELLEYLPAVSTQSEADVLVAYLEAKVFGQKFDFDSCFKIADVIEHHNDVCFSFEGFSNRLGMQAMLKAYQLFYESMVATHDLPHWAEQSFTQVLDALTFSHSHWQAEEYVARIDAGLPTFISSGWTGHSVVIYIHGDKLYRCNRGEWHDGVHGIEEFQINEPQAINPHLINSILEATGAPDFIQLELVKLLGLEKIGQVVNPTQTVGNCVWTSLEAALEASFISTFIEQGIEDNLAHDLAKQSFTVWETFDQSHTVSQMIEQADFFIEQHIYDELLIKVLETHHDPNSALDVNSGIIILNELSEPTVFALFDEKIGQYVMHYDPNSSASISYLADYYEPQSKSYLTTLHDWLMPSPEISLGQTYYDFLLACDMAQQPTLIHLEEVLDITGVADLVIPQESQPIMYVSQQALNDATTTVLPFLQPSIMPELTLDVQDA